VFLFWIGLGCEKLLAFAHRILSNGMEPMVGPMVRNKRDGANGRANGEEYLKFVLSTVHVCTTEKFHMGC
jgi:hypothetical protein